MIFSFAEQDRVFGAEKADILVAGGDADQVSGNPGHDTLQGSQDHDILFAGVGNRLFLGDKGANT